MLPPSRIRFTPPPWLAVLLGLSACDRQVATEYEGDSMLRVRGRISAPLGLENQGLRPVVSFDAMSDPDNFAFDHQHTVPVTVDGEFPSGFTVELRDPPPPQAVVRLVGGEPAYAQGYLMVVGPDYPEVVSDRIPSPDSRPTPECTDGVFCHWSTHCEGLLTDEDVVFFLSNDAFPPGRACLSRLHLCIPDGSTPGNLICTVVREEGDPKLHSTGYAADVEIVYFSEPIEEDTQLAVTYNNGDPISPGYHVYLRPQIPNEPPTPRPCYDQAEAAVLAEYNAKHGTNHLSSAELAFPSPAEDPSMFEIYEWQRAIYRELRKRGCSPNPYPMRELGPDDLIEITLDPSRPSR